MNKDGVRACRSSWWSVCQSSTKNPKIIKLSRLESQGDTETLMQGEEKCQGLNNATHTVNVCFTYAPGDCSCCSELGEAQRMFPVIRSFNTRSKSNEVMSGGENTLKALLGSW